MRVGRTLIATIPNWAQPTVLALLLALVAWPLVAMTMGVGYRDQYIGAGLPTSVLYQWTAAGGGVFLSAAVAGPIGGLVVRRDAIGGGLFTFLLALIVAITGASLLPALLGQNVACWDVSAAGIVSPCDPITTTARVVIEDIQSLPLLFLFAPLAEPVAILTLALGVGVWTGVLARWCRPGLASPDNTRR
jgi:hypothetical protein